MIIMCNQRVVYKYDYKDHFCHQFNDFKPRIKFPNLDTASFMYKTIQGIGKKNL